MRFRSVAAPAALAVVVLTAPAGAQAATLTAVNPKPCYGSGDRVALVAAGFTPGREVSFVFGSRPLRGSLPANAVGNVFAGARLPDLPVKEETAPFTASDGINRASSAPVRASDLNVTLKIGGSPAAKRRIRARGFTTGGSSLYAHIRRGRSKRNVRIGALKGPCKTLNVRRALFRRGRFSFGTYNVQFDTFRRYNAERAQSFRGTLTILRRFGRRSTTAVASGAQGWTWKPAP